jgi:predicted nucleic acid-binding protein
VAPTPASFDRAGIIFRGLFAPGNEPRDRLGTWNDILIALTARQLGGAVITANARDFERLAAFLPGLVVLDPNNYIVS